MRKLCYLFIMIIILLVSMPTCAGRFEGEVVKVLPTEKALVLSVGQTGQMTLKIASNAKLYYNNVPATLNMYTPVTSEDFVSGYVETDEHGLIRTAYFYYLVREGVIEEIQNGKITLTDVENNSTNSYVVQKNPVVYLNNYPADMQELAPGMKVLLVLDYRYQVKKLAVFHYDYTGFLEKVDLNRRVVIVNIGSRLNPVLREFGMGGKLKGACEDWESLATLLNTRPLVQAKILIDSMENTISFIDTRSL